MLVKFLSYIVTLIGTKRYKPLVFSGLALAISLVGVSAVWSVYEQPQETAASTVQKANDPTKETLSEQTLSQRSTRKTTVDPEASSAQPATPPATSNSTTGNTNPAPAISIQTTNDSAVTLKKHSGHQTLSFNLSDNSAVQWSVTSDSANGPIMGGAQEPVTGNIFSFSVRAGQAPAGTYTITVHAKDSVRNLDLTKSITVIIPAE